MVLLRKTSVYNCLWVACGIYCALEKRTRKAWAGVGDAIAKSECGTYHQDKGVNVVTGFGD
jgi:hypothetical protein